jgi:phosphohistidine phosphatase SixA
MTTRRRQLLRAVATAVSLGAALAASAAAPRGDEAWSALQRDGAIVLFRHAIAPGGGDPPGFKLNDCSTQRNLDAVGRQQAKALGQAFRDRKIRVGTVRSSQWCRTRETAQLAFGTAAQDEPAFNSFFEDRSRADTQTAQARQLLGAWRGPGAMVVVTHQVNITALTGVVPASGEGIVMRMAANGLETVGRLPPP